MEGDARPRRVTVAPETMVDFLAKTALFQGCERKTVEKIIPHVFPVQVPAGSMIVRAGTPDPGIGFLYQGRAAIRRLDAATGAQVTVSEVTVGEPFGEIGAFLGTTQPHDVVALDDSVMFLIGHDVVTQLATKVAAFSFAAARLLATRAISPIPTAVPVAVSTPASAPIAAPGTGPVPTRPRSSTGTAPVARPRKDSSQGVRGLRSSAELAVPEPLVFEVADPERDGVPRPSGDEIAALASRLIAHAIERGASDVHVDHGAGGPRVRLRVGGQLHDWEQPIPPGHGRALVARLKELAGLDAEERRRPLDGRLGVRAGRREVDIRISTIPTSRGENVALRVVEGAAMLRPLEAIFLDPAALGAVRAALQRPHGAIVVAGPAGAGKTSTLYAALGERVRTRPETSALTIEDPIEYRLDGVAQVQVDPGTGLSAAQVLRAALRQDPDAIMVGEVREAETARLALEATLAGRLVLASLQAASAMAAVQRLEHLGCSRPLIGQSLALVLAQRLARRLCPRCVAVEPPPAVLLEHLAAHGLADRRAPAPMPRPVGCPDCGQTGYAGRVAIVEVLLLDEGLRAQLTAGVPLADLERAAAESGLLTSFRTSSLQLMASHILSPAEALLAVV
jgi:type II secretory ATPase GspE/PulE/Tfp pilus assembly ATPase PilB-like protein